MELIETSGFESKEFGYINNKTSKNMVEIDNIAMKDILSITSPLIKSLIDTFITPKLEAFRDRNKKNSNDSYIPTESHFSEYLHRTYKKLAVVNTLVFHNSQRLLIDIYLPLTLTSNDKKKNAKIAKVKVTGFPNKISDEFQNILITDTAGMGKSTMMKTIFIDIINKKIGIPLFVELRRLSQTKKLIDEIQEQLNSLEKNFKSDVLLEFLVKGDFIIILDGYDEIALNERDAVTTDIQQFIAKASNNRFFITSRPENALACFGNFQEFKIEPLTKKEAFELLRKYDNKGQVSSLLIKKLQESNMANIEEFLTNPLLVSLLFTAFEHKQAIPFKKYLFYRQVYDANFESHDLTKGDSYTHDKYSKLEIDDFHKVLRYIGFNCFKLQKIEFTKDELLKLIENSKSFCAGLSFNNSDFLSDILKTVPLFTQDGSYYRWAHKSLQEYFAAQFIYLDAKDKQNSILEKLYNHSDGWKFINVLDLYYDMDYKTFRNVIEFALLTEYHDYNSTTYNKIYDSVSETDVIDRKQLMFLEDCYIFKPSSKHFDDKKMGEMLHSIQSPSTAYIREVSNVGIVGIIRCIKQKYSILHLLLNKKNPIVLYNDIPDKNIQINYEFEGEYIPQKITDNEDDQLNSFVNFHNVNLLIRQFNRDVIINHKIALAKLEEIKKNIKLEEAIDFLVEGI
jgi:hypothetical protein